MVTTFATPQEALEALDLDRRFFVTIGGMPTDCISYSGQHGVDQQMATAKLELELPRPAHVVANAAVEVHAGWNNLVGTVFSGRIPAWSGALSRRGAILTVRPVGWSSLLAYPFRFDLVWQGPVTPREIFVALCELRGVPAYRADRMTALDGATPIALGTNPWVDGGSVTLPGGQKPLRWLIASSRPIMMKLARMLDPP